MVTDSLNLPIDIEILEVPKAVPFKSLNPAQQAWVDYNVVQGVYTESDGEMHKVTVSDFAMKLGYDRRTLNEWTRQIPNFWDLVRERSGTILTGARTQKVINAVYMSATVKLNSEAQKLWLGMYAKWQPPAQQHEVNIGGLLDLAQIAERELAIEAGEMVDDGNNPATS